MPPTPVTSGPSQAEGIARFALRARYEDLTREHRERLEVSVLDALGCAINALGAPPRAVAWLAAGGVLAVNAFLLWSIVS